MRNKSEVVVMLLVVVAICVTFSYLMLFTIGDATRGNWEKNNKTEEIASNT